MRLNQKLVKSRNRKHLKKYWLLFLTENGHFSRFFWYSDVYRKSQNKSKVSLNRKDIHYSSSFYRIFLFKQEVFYTKLKYSRVPQFDTSSGAAASFTSGFYGFLVCEKFGFELVDSGDFLFVVIYLFLMVLLVSMVLAMSNVTSTIGRDICQIFSTFKKNKPNPTNVFLWSKGDKFVKLLDRTCQASKALILFLTELEISSHFQGNTLPI